MNGFANNHHHDDILSPLSGLPTTMDDPKINDQSDPNNPNGRTPTNGRKPTIIIDTREKTPYEFDESKFKTKRTRLLTGDYSVAGHQATISIERKTGSDFLNSITHQHKRFFNELQRLSKIPYSMIVVEAHIRDYISGEFSERVAHVAFYGNLFHIMTTYEIKLMFVGDRAHGINFVENWIRWVLRQNSTH